jgi:hypothetical protein
MYLENGKTNRSYIPQTGRGFVNELDEKARKKLKQIRQPAELKNAEMIKREYFEDKGIGYSH